MSVIQRKIWTDLWQNKVRSLLVILSIAVGVFAIGLIFGMADQMTTIMEQTWQADTPPHVIMFLSTAISPSDVQALTKLPGVSGIEPAGAADARYYSPRDGRWHQAVVWMREDYQQQTYDLYRLNIGTWPQGNALGMERLQADFYNVNVGESVLLEFAGQQHTFPIDGTIRHPYAPPPTIGTDLVYFFADAQNMADHFSVPAGQFNTLMIQVSSYSAELAQQVATEVKAQLNTQHIEVVETQYEDPTRHWARSQMDPLMLTIQVMAVAALILGTALVFNTVTALIAQQTRQIGILKAIGALRFTLLQLYLTIVLMYGVFALCLALPLGAVGAFYASRYFLNIFDIPHETFQISPLAVGLQLLAALAVPTLAALMPILRGASITVHEALIAYGTNIGFGRNWGDRSIQRMGAALLPTQYVVVLANVIRHKRRLVLMSFVLVVAGVLFLALNAALVSMTATLDAEFGRRAFDLTVRFDQMQRVDAAVTTARSVSGVTQAELAFGHPVSILHQGTQEAGAHSQLIGVPLESPMYQPLIVEGRWLQPGDDHVIVIGRDLAQANHLQVGDSVTLDLGDLGRSDWQIIGLHRDMTTQLGATNVYAPRESVWKETGLVGWGSFLIASTAQHDAASVNAIADQLQTAYRGQKMPVTEIMTGPGERAAMEKEFRQVVEMLQLLVALTALVGGIGLTGTLSISVIERIREIGILRAMGAQSRTVVSMFLLEAIILALLSWIVAVPISLMAAPLLSNALGTMMLGTGLAYRYSTSAAGLWLILIVIISILAALLPTRSATRISVRQSLAYE